MRLVDREESSISVDSLEELLRWLTEQRAFGVVDRLAEKFADRFEHAPMLLYSLAEARQAQGREDLVREAIAKALAVNSSKNAYENHYRIASSLMQRHRWRWAEAEYRRVGELAPRDDAYSIDARRRLGEALHDRGSEEEAAELLDGVVEDMEKYRKAGNDDGIAGHTVEATRARMHYFHACALDKPDQHKGRLQRLFDALKADASDADVLIAIYRTKGLEPAQVEENRQQIRSAAEAFRQEIQQNPNDPTPYNQIAWLIGNTEGDYREALRCSEKSLELVRADPRLTGSEASLLDTLGRCYYSVGDLENAVKSQSRAVELEPESGLMRNQLEIFQKALEESKKK
jgi:tetratricopeptide (TPR) repeat protein